MIKLSKSCIGSQEKKAVGKVLDNSFLGMGIEVQKFEIALTDFFGRPAVCLSNGTAALQLALQACGIGVGDEVLVPSLTYVASFQAISATGARPVSCDIDPDTFVVNWRDAESRLSDSTKAIMPVHYSGGVGDIEGIYDFAKKYSLRVIEDAAHAFGSTHKGRKIGSFGDISCFSFDGIKNITCGEGGCIVTNDASALRLVKDARLLGVEKDSDMRYSGKRSWEFDVTQQGWRYHMSNIMAAIGVQQLDRFESLANRRRAYARMYDEIFSKNPRIKLIPHDYNSVVPHIYVVRILGLKNRDLLRKKMHDKGIETGVHYKPNHWLSYYKSKNAKPLINTEMIYPEIITLPLHSDLIEDDFFKIGKTLIEELSYF